MKMTTPHISCDENAFGKTVLMPGDPLRSQFIADNFLENPILINNIRGVQGYAGTYKGKQISVMASGMGMPSMGIYSYELFHFFHVENIIRIGTAGGLSDNVHLKDIIIASEAVADSSYVGGNAIIPSSNMLLERAIAECENKGFTYHKGMICTNDFFYGSLDELKKWRDKGALAVEMEGASLLYNAKLANKNALCICTISDCPLSDTPPTTPEERQQSFTNMMEVALETAI